MDERFHEALLHISRLVRSAGPAGEIAERAGWLLADSGTGIGGLNHAFVTDAMRAADGIDGIEEWFAGRGDGFRLILREPQDAAVVAAADARGYARARSQPLMAAELPLREFALPEGVEAAEVRDAGDIRDYLSVRPPRADRPNDDTEAAFIEAMTGTRLFRYFVAREGGRAVATASAAFSGDIVSVSNVWVAEGARRRGIGAAMTAVAAASLPGARWAMLEASLMGEPVYRRMGFRERFRYVQMSPPGRG